MTAAFLSRSNDRHLRPRALRRYPYEGPAGPRTEGSNRARQHWWVLHGAVEDHKPQASRLFLGPMENKGHQFKWKN